MYHKYCTRTAPPSDSVYQRPVVGPVSRNQTWLCVRDLYTHIHPLSLSNIGMQILLFGMTSNNAEGRWFNGHIERVNPDDWSFTASFVVASDAPGRRGETATETTELEDCLHLLMPTVRLPGAGDPSQMVRSSFAFIAIAAVSSIGFLECSCVSITSFKPTHSCLCARH